MTYLGIKRISDKTADKIRFAIEIGTAVVSVALMFTLLLIWMR